MAQTTIQGSFLGDATVTGAKIGADFISAQTALTSGLATTDEIIVSDAGVIKRMDISVLEIAASQITASGTLPALNGAALTALNASNLGSGTIPDARFPATLPAISGANLTNLPAAGATLSGSTDNTVVTVTGSNAMVGEANLTYDGAELNVGSTGAKLVLDQSTGGAYLLELRSTGAVAHGISGYNTATYGQFMKKHATSGMLQIWGFSDADANQAIGLSLVGVSGIAANTAKTPAAIGVVEILGGIKNGSAIANPGPNGNILVVRDAASGSAKMIVDQEGEVTVKEGNSMTSVTKGIAKAWVSFDYSGSTPSKMGSSYNVASLGDTDTGHVTVNYTNTLDNAHAATVGMTQSGTLGANMTGTSQSTSSVQVKSSNGSNTAVDYDGSVVIFGENA